ncbi:MAG TPA: UDP-N-acetylmuramoyl-L-alanyl-D-glutamate--2,6-diaminopimelate ligase, partial [Aeromicrobium sp.]|nr:UDP-N-acetylmuramoyl-L-alanyl-D-glutamate--2,6-diaminopimelate ligase [Aeromicrobium sp.]
DDRGAGLLPDVPAIVVDDPRARLAEVSAWFYDHPSTAFRTIGVTGTQGKTTATYLAEAALSARRPAIVGTIGTRIAGVQAASSLTTPEAPDLQALFAVMREEAVDACVLEVSSHALTLGRVDGFTFDVGVFLNLGRDHLDFHGDVQSYFLAKAALFTPSRARHAVVNADDTQGKALIELIGDQIPVTTFSTAGRVADWRATNIRAHRLGTDLSVLMPDGRDLPLSVPLPGIFNVSNAVAVLAALAAAGFDPEEAAAGIASSPGVPGRMERIEEGQDFTVVVDYAHKPDAITAVLAALRPVTAGRLIVVVGAGGDRDQGKRPLMGAAAAQVADLVIVTDDNPRSEDPAAIRSSVLAGASVGPAAVVEVADRRDAIEHAIALAHRGDAVVIAGKGHETGQEIAGEVHPFDDRIVVREALARSTR